MKCNLQTVANFTNESPFTMGQVRWLIFNAKHNGLAEVGAIIKFGRRVYIDVDAFERWTDSKKVEAA